MKTKKTYKDFESAMQRLQEVTAQLESGEVKLEEAIELYTEGLEIARQCDLKLTEAEKKIKIIMEKNGRIEEEDFEEKDSRE
ncbi:exodeoxyribonuclease VII small subunit [candidate division GN15 bacterium]|uniref:Exodeoxyribonuclease 7 small subunit n=1 Tax=candidate division GN15 bacterium TaxID=2072418 RepID=A0A855X362_9BACT|nr:MAG: exodeoxyribonuclease VII small subunit [candidate division GN15 bacterium]